MHVVATAGHVDHGKSTLIRALTGMEPDRFAEEQRRGMTIDLGFAWTALPGGQQVAFVDVPGHERFVTTMLAGAGPVPAALFVVAADEGWMPQSAEHLDALTALGVGHGVLVVTRSDLMAPELARDEAREHLAGTPLAGIAAVCVSARTGEGMDALRTALAELTSVLPEPDPGADVRFWIDRAFTIRGAGTVVTGTLGAGRIRIGDELSLVTAEGLRTVVVRGLQALGDAVDEIGGVSRVAINLRGVPRESVARGDVVVSPGAWLTADLLDVRLHGRRPGDEPRAPSLPAQLSLHIGAAAVAAHVRPLGHDTVRLRLPHALPLRIGDRAVLRDPGRRQVVAGLTVLDVRPPALGRRGAAARRAVDLIGVGGVPDAVDELARRGRARRVELVAMGVDRAEVGALAQRVPGAGGWLLDPSRATTAAAELAAAVTRHDAADPLDPGLPVEAARRAADLPDARLVEAVLEHAALTDAPTGLALLDGRLIQRAPAEVPPAVRAALDAVRADLGDAPFVAPEAARLAELGLGPREVALLVRRDELLRVADGVVLLPDAPDRALEALIAAGYDDVEFTLSQARQAWSTSRRVAVPLMELLGRTGRTVRTISGDHRLGQP